MLSAPLVWLLVVFALAGFAGSAGSAGPLALRSQESPGIQPNHAVTNPHLQAAAPETSDDDTEGSPGVLGLPSRIHLVVNRTGTGTAPTAPVLAVLSAPVDRTDAGIRIVTDRAGTTPADAPPANSRWERAPPRA
ncbi:hypothetical protein GCM10009558_071280 [Virgisporangium aurantiacum]